jgi:hypothetical protein
MPKFIGTINVGFGPSHVVIEAETEDQAREALYGYWLQECENNCDRKLVPWSQELEDDLEPDEI